jgi:hypothetical protein
MSRKDRDTFPSLGKALFIDFEEFSKWYELDGGHDWSSVKIDDSRTNHSEYIYPKYNIISDMVKIDDLYHKTDGIFNKKPLEYRGYLLLKKLQTYITKFGGHWDVLYIDDIFTIIKFGESTFLILNQFLNIQLFNTHEDLTLGELNSKLYLNSNSENSNSLITNSLSLASVKSQESAQWGEINKLQSDITAIEKELDDKIQALRQEAYIQKQKIERMKTGLQVKIEELHTQIFMLETLVYAVECKLGEIVDFIQLKDGDKSSIDTPLVVFQKIRYLDEDLPIFASIYDFEFSDSYMFEELLQNREDIVEYFCPSEKCISFVRVSKTSTHFSTCPEQGILKEYKTYHGKTIGILVRNGNSLYFGWTDEHRILLPDGNVFYTPGTSEIHPDDVKSNGEDLIWYGEYQGYSKGYREDEVEQIPEEVREEVIQEHYDKKQIQYYKDKYGFEGRKVAAKVFIFSIIEGLLDDKKLVEIPEKVSLLSKPSSSKYLIFSYADGTLEDNRYGDFSGILDRIKDKNKWGDIILSTTRLSDYPRNSGWGYTGFQRSVDGSSRTRDCDISDCTLYTINLIEPANDYHYEQYYVSVKKDWSEYGARSNFQLHTDEFINLTYLNSEWLHYAIMNKKIGSFRINGSIVTYAHAVKYLKTAHQYLKEREITELELIEKYYSNISNNSTWMVELSEWKLLKSVRNITDWQAKRFAKYMEEK